MINILEIYSFKTRREEKNMKKNKECCKSRRQYKDLRLKWKQKEKFNKKKEGKKGSIFKKCFLKTKKINKGKKRFKN